MQAVIDWVDWLREAATADTAVPRHWLVLGGIGLLLLGALVGHAWGHFVGHGAGQEYANREEEDLS